MVGLFAFTGNIKMTYTEQLAEINTAITRVLTAGQQVGRGGAYAQQASLPVLLSERKRLEPLAAAEEVGINTPVIRFGVPVRSQ